MHVINSQDVCPLAFTDDQSQMKEQVLNKPPLCMNLKKKNQNKILYDNKTYRGFELHTQLILRITLVGFDPSTVQSFFVEDVHHAHWNS